MLKKNTFFISFERGLSKFFNMERFLYKHCYHTINSKIKSFDTHNLMVYFQNIYKIVPSTVTMIMFEDKFDKLYFDSFFEPTSHPELFRSLKPYELFLFSYHANNQRWILKRTCGFIIIGYRDDCFHLVGFDQYSKINKQVISRNKNAKDMIEAYERKTRKRC